MLAPPVRMQRCTFDTAPCLTLFILCAEKRGRADDDDDEDAAGDDDDDDDAAPSKRAKTN
jgi:hypothetical protein